MKNLGSMMLFLLLLATPRAAAAGDSPADPKELETSVGLMAKIGAAWSPSFSPDGKRLAFTSGERDASTIDVIDVTGENRRQVARGGAWMAAWRPR